MKAILLAGGLGTRMREETEFRPKPMVEIGGRPVLWHIMKNLAHFGIKDFIIATGYKSELIKDYFLNYEAMNNDFTIRLGRKDSLIFHDTHQENEWKVTVAFTGETTLTEGRVYQAAKYLDDEPFLVTYGDGLADINMNSLRDAHQAAGTIATVTTFQPRSRYGIMDTNENGLVCKFLEKPIIDGWINIGFFLFNSEVLNELRPDGMLEERLLPSLASKQQLSTYRHDGFWQPMDTFRESRMLNDLWETGNAPWKTW